MDMLQPVVREAPIASGSESLEQNMLQDGQFGVLVELQAQHRRAVGDLRDFRATTLAWLKELDASLTNQWIGVGVAKTISAGLGIAAAITIFFAPPVGIGLGIGSGVVGATTGAGDYIADKTKRDSFVEMMQQDRDLAQHFLDVANNVEAVARALAERFGFAVDHVLLASEYVFAGTAIQLFKYSADMASAAAKFSKASAAAAPITFGDDVASAAAAGGTAAGARVTVSVFGKIMTIAGAVISVGDAVYSWMTTSPTQSSVRNAIVLLESFLADLTAVMTQ